MYKLTENPSEVIKIGWGTVVEGTQPWKKYEAWLVGNTPDPADAPTALPTASEIYDQAIKNSKVLKALILSINDGSIVPGANVSGAVLKTAIKAKM